MKPEHPYHLFILGVFFFGHKNPLWLVITKGGHRDFIEITKTLI